jgi:protein tyrosine phosphatase (PTP) superfamily phosphohydrolase (DUF442 family)
MTRAKRNFIVIAVVVVVLSAVNFIYYQFGATYHFVEVDPGKVYRDGNRSVREFKAALRKSNAKTVVAVIDDEEYMQPEFAEARELLKSRGIGYHWIKIKAGRYPRPEQVVEFLSIASDPAKQPVLYHDDEGIRRAGMMMAAYQMSVLKYDREKAKASIKAFGHSDRTIDEVRRFIDAYDPVRGLTVDLNATETATTAATTQP